MEMDGDLEIGILCADVERAPLLLCFCPRKHNERPQRQSFLTQSLTTADPRVFDKSSHSPITPSNSVGGDVSRLCLFVVTPGYQLV